MTKHMREPGGLLSYGFTIRPFSDNLEPDATNNFAVRYFSSGDSGANASGSPSASG